MQTFPHVNRLVSVTSINQLIVGLSCLRHNRKNGVQYNDVLIVNNVLVTDKACEEIRSVAKKVHDFTKIIDFREQLKKIDKYIKHTRGLSFLFSTTKGIEKTNSTLKKKIGCNNFHEVYLRYKINFPEHLILTTFPDAKVFLFEDGLRDYMKPQMQKIFFKTMIKKILFNFGTVSALRNHILNYNYDERIENKYSVVYDNSEYISIKRQYKKILNEINLPKNFTDPKGFEYVLLVLHHYSEFSENLGFDANIKQELRFYSELVERIRQLFVGKKLIIKAHPLTSPELRAEYSKIFGKSFILDIQNIPAEVLAAHPTVKVVIGALSSCLLYSRKCFNKETFFVIPYFYPRSEKTELEKEALHRHGVREISI